MAVDTGEITEVIDAPLDRIVAALTDFESHQSWQAMVKASRVLERDDAGRGILVEERLDVKVRIVRLVARYTYDLPRAMEWTQVEGDIKMLRCGYTFDTNPDGATVVRVRLAFDVGFYVPRAVKRVIRDQALLASLRELKAHVER